MCILVRALLRLSLLDPSVEEVDSFVVLLLQLSFDTFVLDVLEAIHLPLTLLLGRLGFETGACVLHRLVLTVMPLLNKLEIVLVKNNLLNIVVGHLAHEQALSVSFFIALDYFILEAQESKYLIEHVWLYASSCGK